MTQAQVIIEEYPTKSQIQQLLRAWGVGDELPTKGMPSRLIVWPKNSDVEVESACIQFSDRTSDAGESLYQIYDEMMDIHPLLDFALGSFGRAHEHPAERSDEDGRPRSTQGMGM